MIMMKRKPRGILLFCLLSLCGLSGAHSQDSSLKEPVFAPFVSRLQAEIRNNLVRLSWLDSVDAAGPVYIFRSLTPFTGTGPNPSGMPIEVPYGTQYYVDEIEPSGGGRSIYYFIAASGGEVDGSGSRRRYDVFIPYNNTIQVDMSAAEGLDLWFAQTPRPAESGIFGLEARVQANGVLINYRQISPSKNTILYRSVRPIRETRDLLSAVIVQSGIDPPFTDYPVPGILYYYAVIFEDDLTRGSVGIYPGRNATLNGVEVPSDEDLAGFPRAELRSMPLPLLSLYNALPGADSFTAIPDPVPMSPAAEKAVEALGRPEAKKRELKWPRAFNQDLESPAGGEESVLRSIVQENFLKRDWPECRLRLLSYLSIPRSGSSEGRARFYLGQTWYYSGNYREALLEFLAVEDAYPQEAGEWIQETLYRLIQY